MPSRAPHSGVDLEQARRTAQAELDRFSMDGGAVPLVLTLGREFAEGWVFLYNSARFQQTGAFRDGLVGNAPLIVDRDTGQIHITGTAQPIEDYLADYVERKRRLREG